MTALLDQIIAIALAAGRDILDAYGRDVAVSWKSDNSPVTEADMRAERIILQGLDAVAPAVPVVAEESVAAGRVPPPASRFFLVDPLDGSKEFLARNGEFTVNIGLIEAGVPVLGVVHAPALGRVWWGGAGQGAFVADVVEGAPTQTRPIASAPRGPAGYRVVGSRSHASSAELNGYLAALEIAEMLRVGSSLKFCLLAEGKADLYPRFGRTMEWDTAAGDAVLRAAGGEVLTVAETPLTYGKSDFANPHFIARATCR